MSYHAYIDKSKRKPYICGVCGKDITNPVHQPPLIESERRESAIAMRASLDIGAKARRMELEAPLFFGTGDNPALDFSGS